MAIFEKLQHLYSQLEKVLEQIHNEDLAAELQQLEKDIEALASSLGRILHSSMQPVIGTH